MRLSSAADSYMAIANIAPIHSHRHGHKGIKMSNLFILFIIFCMGACIGSFLNVCIWRVPRSESIVSPGSRCPQCSTPIRFYDNIPILSYILLMGKCRHCKSGISIRYPLVEGLTGVLAMAAAFRFGLTLDFLIYFIFISVLVTVTFIDLDLQIIPDVISLPGIPIGLAASLVLTTVTFKDSLIGALVGGGSLFLVAWGYYYFTKKEGMGGGDIKLLAMIGAFIGWQGVFFTIFIASAVGSVTGAILMLFAKKDLKFAVAFGPFLALGALAYLFVGPELIDWYYHSAFR
jgi:leader peptidase (prepilin peptidase)/N-methyltransferase